jgi:hypothetical protein
VEEVRSVPASRTAVNWRITRQIHVYINGCITSEDGPEGNFLSAIKGIGLLVSLFQTLLYSDDSGNILRLL